MLKARLDVLRRIQSIAIHIIFVAIMATARKVIEDPSGTSLMQTIAPCLSYLISALLHSGTLQIQKESHFRCAEITAMVLFALMLSTTICVTEIEEFLFWENLVIVAVVLNSVAFMDLMVTVPTCFMGFATIIYKRWEFEGFANVTMMRICSTVVSHMCVASAVVFLVYSMQRSIAAKLESGDAFSLLRGFRKVLRGVCDGDLVLDNEFQIVGDDTSLEQLLKSERQLVGTNFLDLFLDIEGRQCFKQFLNAESASKQMDKMDNRDAFALPRGLRVSLQGAEGPISADVFCTRVPNGEGPDYCLLALKEDPEQHLADCAPCAPPSEGSQVFEASSTAKLGSQGSSIPEIFASAFEDLVQVALLVSNDSVGLDIEEATLSFERSPNETMPTLRKLLRGSGLERVKRACQSVCNLPEGEHHALRSPLRFRIPGAPGSSLSAERVHISVDREMPGQFWMHLSALRTSHRKERELEGIIEE